MNEVRSTGGLVGVVLVVLALAGADGSRGNEMSVLEGRMSGAERAGGVWLGVVGEDSETGNWMLVEHREFGVLVPPGRVTLVALAKGRVPLVVTLARRAERGQVELDLQQGLSLEGTVRSADGNVLQGVDIGIVPSKAIVQGELARLGMVVSLDESKTELVLADGRRVTIPPFVWPKWKTNRHGVFRIEGLEAGPHDLEASSEGYVSERISRVEVRRDADTYIDMVLARGFFVAGHVVDGDGVSVADAEVRGDWLQPKAEPYRDRSGEMVHRVIRRRAAVRTTDDGSFRIGPFEAGPKLEVVAISREAGSSRRMEVFAPYEGLVLELRQDVVRGRVVDAATGEPIDGFELRTHRNGRTRATRHAGGHFEVQVDPDTDSIDIQAPGRFPWFARLRPGGGAKDLGEIALEKARSITGRVRHSRSGDPIAGALVSRAWQHYEDAFLRVYTANLFGNRGARTGADGTFVLGDLPNGADRLEVRVRDRPMRFVDLPPDVNHLEIELAFDSVIAGTLGLPDGTPVEGTVRLRASEGYISERKVAADGAFRWDGLEGGEYRLTVESDAGVVGTRTVTVADGDSADDIRLVVEAGGRLWGTINGLFPTEDVTVTLWDRHGATVLRRDFGNGAYSLQGVPQATTVTARTNERRPPLAGALVRGTPIADRALARSVRLDEQGEAQLDLDFTGRSRLTGTVRSGERPLGGIDLAVVPEDRSRPTAYATTGEQGRFAVQGISAGLHSVQTRSGHSFEVYVVDDATLDIELPPVSLSGTVRNARTGQPVGGGWSRLERIHAPGDSRTMAIAVRIDGDGSFRFEGLVSGEYVVRLSHRDFADISRRVSITGSETVEFQMVPADVE